MSIGVSLILETLGEVRRMAGKPIFPVATCIGMHVRLYEQLSQINYIKQENNFRNNVCFSK